MVTEFPTNANCHNILAYNIGEPKAYGLYVG